jgi:hypothetical protein
MSIKTSVGERTHPQTSGLEIIDFSRFPQLAIELRLHIWEIAIADSSPNVISISWPRGRRYEPEASYLIPAFLRACKESHSVTKKVYSLVFSKILARDRLTGDSRPENPVYMDLTKDLLFIDRGYTTAIFLLAAEKR